MKMKMKSMNEVMLSMRRTWDINPVQRVCQSKKVYSRKNKSWKKMED